VEAVPTVTPTEITASTATVVTITGAKAGDFVAVFEGIPKYEKCAGAGKADSKNKKVLTDALTYTTPEEHASEAGIYVCIAPKESGGTDDQSFVNVAKINVVAGAGKPTKKPTVWEVSAGHTQAPTMLALLVVVTHMLLW